MKINIVLVLSLSLVFTTSSFGQNKLVAAVDSLPVQNDYSAAPYKYTAKQLFVPSSLILLGATGLLEYPWTKPGIKLQEKVVNQWNTPFKTYSVDNVLVFLPAASVYGLNIIGLKGEHNFWDRTIILATSAVVTLAVVEGLKSATHNLRPDATTYDSWPSGHTAIAFAGAEFLHQEYKDQSVWISVSGYATATSVGALRVYNNRHWLTDVVAGAGFGILGTKVAYWLFPVLKEHVFTSKSTNKKSTSSVLIIPSYSSNQLGFQLAATF